MQDRELPEFRISTKYRQTDDYILLYRHVFIQLTIHHTTAFLYHHS